MARKRTKTDFENVVTKLQYIDRLRDLALSVFEWENVPDTIDTRFLELSLITHGNAIFFEDDVMGYLALNVMQNGPYDVYNIPINRRAYASNGYQMELNRNNSVIIYNNYTHTNCINDIENYSNLLYTIDRIIEINTIRQASPWILRTSEEQALTLENLFNQILSHKPIIITDKNIDIPSMIQNIDISAPFVGLDLFSLKRKIWGEAMNYIGLTANTEDKAERQVTIEVDNYNQNTYAQRFTRLASRKDACKKINKMFGLNIDVSFRKDIERASITQNNDEMEASENE